MTRARRLLAAFLSLVLVAPPPVSSHDDAKPKLGTDVFDYKAEGLPLELDYELRHLAGPDGAELLEFADDGRVRFKTSGHPLTNDDIDALGRDWQERARKTDATISTMLRNGVLQPHEGEGLLAMLHDGRHTTRQVQEAVERAGEAFLKRAGKPLDAKPVPKLEASGATAFGREAAAVKEDASAVLPAWMDGLPGRWASVGEQYDATKAAAGYLKSPKVKVRFAAKKDLGTALAKYDDGVIYVSAEKIQDAAKQLRAQGVSEKDLPNAVALKTLPILAHEAEHGLLDAEVRKRTGRSWPMGFQENEVRAFRTTAAAAKELREKNPGFWDAHRVQPFDIEYDGLLAARARGPNGLENHVRRCYTAPTLATADRGELKKLYKGNEKTLREALATLRDAKKKGDQATVAMFPSEELIVGTLDALAGMQKTLADARMFDEMQRIAREQTETARSDWKDPSWVAWRQRRDEGEIVMGGSL